MLAAGKERKLASLHPDRTPCGPSSWLDKQFRAQALDPHCLGSCPNLTTSSLTHLRAISDPLLPPFLSSNMGVVTVPGASCLTFRCLSILTYKVETVMTVISQIGQLEG